MSGEGQQQMNNLSGAGFSTDEVGAWQAQKRQELGDAGFNQEEINDYFGQKAPNDKAIADTFHQILAPAAEAAKGEDPATAKPFTFSDAVKAGWQQSVSGLMLRQKMPDVTLPENNTWYQRIAYSTAGIAGDLPAMVGGFLAGGGAGGAAGAAAGSETGPGAVVTGGAGAVVTGTAAAFAMPTLLRETMMDSYKNGEFHTPSEFMARASGIFIDTAKSYVTGAATAGAGIVAKPALAAAGATGAVATAGTVASEVGAMVTTAKALDGQLPKAQDFIDAALLIGAFKTVPFLAGKVQDGIDLVKQHAPDIADNLRNVYAKTGVPPDQVLHDMQQDPTIAQDLIAKPGEVPDAYKPYVDPITEEKPVEPKAPAPPEEGTLEAAQKTILDKVQVGGEDKTPAKNWDSFYTKVVDDMHPLKLAVEDMSGEKADRSGVNPYILARLTRGSFGKADQFLTQSPYEFDTYKNVGKSLESIIEPYKADLDGVRAYAVAKRTIELEGRGIKSGFDLEAANKIVNESGDKYAGVVKDLSDYQDHLTAYLRDSGVLSGEAYDAMREANKNYVPFYRVFEEAERRTTGGAGKGIGTKDPIKAIQGSDRAVIDPLESIIKNTYAYIALADRNEVADKFITLAEDAQKNNPDAPVAIEKVKTPIKGITVQDKEMTKFLQDQGITEVPDDLLTIFRAARQPLADDEIAVFRDGERSVYKIDPDVAAVFKAADRETANWLFRIISAPTKMFRAGVTLSPDFFPRNVIRDQYDALINSRSGFFPLLDTVRGAASMIQEDDSFQNWLKSGGANATMVTLDRDYIQNNVIKLNEETGFADHVWNLAKSPFDALRIVSELAENATRLGEFKKAYQKGVDAGMDEKSAIQNAGFQSREVTLDFARIGAKTQAVNMLIAFWNAQLQGVDRLGRRLAENPTGTMAKIGAAITLPSMLLWWANSDDPRYKAVPDWQKDMFWIVMTDNWRALKEGEASPPEDQSRMMDGQKQYNMGTIYRIPKPHEAGILFGSGIERFMDWMKGSDPKAAEHYTSDVLQSFAPGYVPTVAQPVIEQFANKSLFTGGKIVPSATEGLLPEVQYQPYTMELTKALGKIVGMLPTENKPGTMASPAIMENYIRQWSGGLGMYAVQLADAGLRKVGVLPDPVMPVATLADIPFIKAFVVRYPSAGAQPVQDFYDRFESKMQVINTMKYLAKSGDAASAIRLANLNPDAIAGQLTGIKTALSNQQKFIQMVYKNPMTDKDPAKLTSAERDSIASQKRQLIESAYYQMINTAQMGNAIMRQVDESMNK